MGEASAAAKSIEEMGAVWKNLVLFGNSHPVYRGRELEPSMEKPRETQDGDANRKAASGDAQTKPKQKPVLKRKWKDDETTKLEEELGKLVQWASEKDRNREALLQMLAQVPVISGRWPGGAPLERFSHEELLLATIYKKAKQLNLVPVKQKVCDGKFICGRFAIFSCLC